MVVTENYYKEREAEHDEIKVTVREMVKDWGLKIATRGGYWTIHNDPWYITSHNPLITVIHMGFRLIPEVTIHCHGYEDLAQQIASFLDLKFSNKKEI